MFRILPKTPVLLALCFISPLLAQTLRPLDVNESHYRAAAGERLAISTSSETVAFLRSAKTRIARSSAHNFAVAPNVAGDQVLLGIPLTMPPGDYSVEISATGPSGEERKATVQVTVDSLPTVPTGAATPPVVLFDGFQLALSSSCPIASDSTGTLGNLQSYLSGSPNFAPQVYFFENCTNVPAAPSSSLAPTSARF